MMIPGAKNGDPAGVRQIQKTVCQIVKTCPFIGTLGRGHSTRTFFFSGEAGILILQSCHVFS